MRSSTLKITTTIFIFIFICTGADFFKSPKVVRAAECFYPVQYLDDIDRVYNHSVCQNYFQVYYFPVITDGRKYTITLRSITGEQKIYASRYKNEVDELSDLQNWYCNDDHCESGIQVDEKTKIINFRSPTGEAGYYSWFAVYGQTESDYQIGISNNGVLSFVSNRELEISSSSETSTITPALADASPEIPNIFWRATSVETAINFNETSWTEINFNDDSWKNTALPDEMWYCNNCFRKYRGSFNLESIPQDLKMSFSSDDGLWLYVNGKFIGHWGADSNTSPFCVNNYGCANVQKVDDILLTNLVKGKNVISAIVYDGGGGEYFGFRLRK